MSRRQRLILPFVITLAFASGGGCLCWLTGDCIERTTLPTSPFPSDGAIEVPISVTLSWGGGAAPEGKYVRHDVYLSTINPPVLYRPSVTGRSLTLDSLAKARTYYWRVILIEENGNNIEGPLWTFTTEFPPKFLSVSYPNWATIWSPGEVRTIQWRAAYAGSSVRVELHKSGTTLCTIAESTPNDGFLDWVMSGCVEQGDPDYRVKVTSLSDESLYDFSDFFTVPSTCPIDVSSPKFRETWISNQLRSIRWHPLGQSSNSKVFIHLFKGSDFRSVISPLSQDSGLYNWVVDDFGGGSGEDYRVRVTVQAPTGCSQFSDFFEILACTVQVHTPALDAIWPLGSQQMITWDPAYLPETATLELHHRNGFVCVLDENAPNTGSYLWTVSRCESQYGEDFQIKLHGGPGEACGFSQRFSFH